MIAEHLLQRHLQDTAVFMRNARIASPGYPLAERMRMTFAEGLRDHRSRPTLHLNLMALSGELPLAANLKPYVDSIVDEFSQILAEDRPEAPKDIIRLCATLHHQTTTTLVHSAISMPSLDRDSVVTSHFDAFNVANMEALDRSATRRLCPYRPDRRSAVRRRC